MKISCLKPIFNRAIIGSTVSFRCIVAGVYVTVKYHWIWGRKRPLCLSVLILEFLTALCAGRAALPALMWPSASGFRCCQERRDSSVHWPERCPAVPVVSCVWTSRVKPAPETRRAGEGSSTTSWRERMTHSTLGTLVRNSYACDWW